MADKSWAEFEKLVAKIMGELSLQADVKWNDSIYGHDTETDRQIDVSIRATLDGYEVLVIVQAKNWGAPADVNTVGEFASVIKDVRATKGILVCRSGFTSKAKTYARNIGIELTNMHDAESRDWNQDIRIPILWIDLHPQVQFAFEAHLEEQDIISPDNLGYILSPDKGQTRVNMFSTFENKWNDGTLLRTVGIEHRITSSQSLYILVEDKTGNRVWRPTETVQIIYFVGKKAWLGYFKPDQCRGIIDYLNNGTFIASYLPIGQIPVQRDENWTQIDNSDEVAVNVKGTLATTEGWQIIPGSGKFTDASIVKLD